MLSYQHAYHAGGPADMHKHLALAELLHLLTVKDRGISYLETHAGRGLYDLGSEEAKKTGEAEAGLGQVASLAKSTFGAVLAKVRKSEGPAAYPGSPLIAASLLRPQDRISLLEKHPAEHGALCRTMKRRGAEIHLRDAYEGARALVPMRPRRGLVLIDPSYEDKGEYRRAGRLAQDLRALWPEAAVLLWYPVLAAGRHQDLLDEAGDGVRDEAAFDLNDGRGMLGSGLLLLGAPYGSGEALEKSFAAASPLLRRAP